MSAAMFTLDNNWASFLWSAMPRKMFLVHPLVKIIKATTSSTCFWDIEGYNHQNYFIKFRSVQEEEEEDWQMRNQSRGALLQQL